MRVPLEFCASPHAGGASDGSQRGDWMRGGVEGVDELTIRVAA